MADQSYHKRAAGYVRVSTQDQADSGASLSAQRAKIEAYCTMHDLDLVQVIRDAGHSAKSLDRPGMTNLLQLIQRQKVDVVIVAKLDRITRTVRDLGELVDLFHRTGIEFASVSDHIDTSTAAGRLVLNVMGSVSQWEREAIGERTSEALTAMRAQGKRISRHAPYGYRLTDGVVCGAPLTTSGVSRTSRAIRRITSANLSSVSRLSVSVGSIIIASETMSGK